MREEEGRGWEGGGGRHLFRFFNCEGEKNGCIGSCEGRKEGREESKES
jgi:hypothetical protein